MHLFFSQIPFSSCSVILDYWSCLQNIRQEFFRQWIDYVINKIKSLGSEIYLIQKNLKSKHLLLLKAGHILLIIFIRFFLIIVHFLLSLLFHLILFLLPLLPLALLKQHFLLAEKYLF